MKLQFTKMHSLGNDFIVIDARDMTLKKLPGLAKTLCNRRFGVGADQMLLLCRSSKADFKMRILNADGSEVEMCGNGIRCLGKYIWDRKIRGQGTGDRGKKSTLVANNLSIETLAGIKHLRKIGELIEVDMGEPVFDPDKIPVIKKGARGKQRACPDSFIGGTSKGQDALIDYPLRVGDKTFRVTCISMGNPHAVIVARNVHTVPLEQYGPLIERHKLFPKRTNVEFIQIINRKNIRMRVWERGAGETTACGTGASASGVAAALLGLSGRDITVHLPGGRLRIHWSDKDNHVYMTGDAVKVFEGVLEI